MSTPYDIYPAIMRALDLISQGHTVTRACDAAGVTIVSFERHLASNAQLGELYVEAERRGHDAMAEALLHPDNNKLYGQTNPQMAKIVSDNIKWFLSKRDQKRFGEKVQVEHSITADRAIIEALDRAKLRAIEGRVIDVTPVIANDVIDVLVDEDDAILADLLS